MVEAKNSPFKNRTVTRADGKGAKAKSGITERQSKSLRPKFENYRQVLDTIYLTSPVLALTFEMQALTGLRYSDASSLIESDFKDDNGNWLTSFTFIPIKPYNIALQRLENHKDKSKWSEEKKKKAARDVASIEVFVNRRIQEVVEEALAIKPDRSEFLFASDHRFSAGNPVSIQYANRTLKRLAKRYPDLGFENLGSHSFRKYFADNLYHRHEASLKDIQVLLGHRSIETSAGYVSSSSESLKELINRIG